MRHLLLCATIAGLCTPMLGCEASDPSQPAAIAASAAATAGTADRRQWTARYA